MEEKKFKDLKNSDLTYLEETIEVVKIGDRTIERVERKWKVATQPLNLGSIAKPNKKIKEVRYRVGEKHDSQIF